MNDKTSCMSSQLFFLPHDSCHGPSDLSWDHSKGHEPSAGNRWTKTSSALNSLHLDKLRQQLMIWYIRDLLRSFFSEEITTSYDAVQLKVYARYVMGHFFTLVCLLLLHSALLRFCKPSIPSSLSPFSSFLPLHASRQLSYSQVLTEVSIHNLSVKALTGARWKTAAD